MDWVMLGPGNEMRIETHEEATERRALQEEREALPLLCRGVIRIEAHIEAVSDTE